MACRFCQILRPPPVPIQRRQSQAGGQKYRKGCYNRNTQITRQGSSGGQEAGGGTNSNELLLVSVGIDGGGAQPERYKLPVKGSEAAKTEQQ